MGNHAVKCPTCGQNAKVTQTKYGRRNDCCGFHSWGRRELVSAEVHTLRQKFHAVFDPIWKGGAIVWLPRGEAYSVLAMLTGFPQRDCHGMNQSDPAKLRRLIETAEQIAQGK